MRSVTAGTIVLMVGLSLCGQLSATLIHIKDDPNGMPGWRGQAAVKFETFPEPRLSAWIEYNVYSPGQFNKSFPGADPNGTEYIYAYEIFNNDPNHPWPDPNERLYVGLLSVGLQYKKASVDANSPSYVDLDDSQYLDPNRCTAAISSVQFRFAPLLYYTTTGAGVSDILFFASPYAPQMYGSTLTAYGSFADTENLPSPVPSPDPATLMLISGMAGVLFVKKRRARPR